MHCPICNFEIGEENICSNCKEDIYIFKKVLNISYKLYNDGICKAKNKDFSGAIVSLRKSLYFSKKNIEARNLLGLLYYQIGYLAESFKEWVISTNIDDSEENKAFYYISSFRNDIRNFEKLDDAVRLYNQAIIYLSKKNDDLAVIRLKRVLSINPNFLDAMNLLAFCYIIQGKTKKALKLSKNVLLIDIKNTIALHYINKIEKNYKSKRSVISEQYMPNGMIKSIFEEDDNDKIHSNNPILSYVYSFIFGIILSLFFMYFLFIPDYVQKKNIDLQDLNNKYENYNIKIEELKNKIKVLEEENLSVKKEFTEYISNVNLKENMDNIDKALNFYKDGKKEEAKSVINNISTEGFNEEAIKKYNFVKQKVNR